MSPYFLIAALVLGVLVAALLSWKLAIVLGFTALMFWLLSEAECHDNESTEFDADYDANHDRAE